MKSLREPVRRVALEKIRFESQLTGDARTTFNDLVMGKVPWPLYLHGLAGRGKTCAGLCLIDRTCGEWWDLPALCDTLNQAQYQSYFNDAGYREYPSTIWTNWRDARVGFLDEVGTRSKVTDTHYDVLRRALDAREGKPAVYMSNLALAEIASVYDDRIASRLASGTVLELTGEDRRLTPPPGR